MGPYRHMCRFMRCCWHSYQLHGDLKECQACDDHDKYDVQISNKMPTQELTGSSWCLRVLGTPANEQEQQGVLTQRLQPIYNQSSVAHALQRPPQTGARMEPREGNSKHGIALTLKARSLVVDTSCGVLRGWRRGRSLLKQAAGAVRKRECSQKEGMAGTWEEEAREQLCRDNRKLAM